MTVRITRSDGSVIEVEVSIVKTAPSHEDPVAEVERIRGWHEWQPEIHHPGVETENFWRDMGTLLSRVDELGDTIRWMAQTVHQAHHEGPIEKCPKSTCDAVMKVLGRKE